MFRTSSEPYNPDDLDDELSHITNHCVQEHGPNFSKFEEGNEMWYHQFQAYLDQVCTWASSSRLRLRRGDVWRCAEVPYTKPKFNPLKLCTLSCGLFENLTSCPLPPPPPPQHE